MSARDITLLFGKNIKFYRNLKRWSQEALAEKAGVSKNTICEIETGKKFVHAERLDKFSEIFGVDVYKLFMPEDVVAKDTTGILTKLGTEVTEKVYNIFENYIDDLNKQNRYPTSQE